MRRWREHCWAYARLTERVDAQIGRLLDALQEAGRLDDTLIVFTSDHGDMDATHRMEHKSTLYDEACRIPLIIRPPGGLAGGRVDREHLVSNGLDLLPTLCDWAGVSPQGAVPGRSLRRLVECGTDDLWRESIGVECAIGRAAITRRFKYSRYDIGANAEQLVDLECDPFEQKNALHNPEYQQDLPALRRIWEETFGGQSRDPAAVARAAVDA